MNNSVKDILRRIPQVDFLMRQLGDEANLAAAREVLDGLRQGVLSGDITEIPDDAEILTMIAEKGAKTAAFVLGRVVNATGVVLHTNLGRAPMLQSVAEHVARVALGYCNLEYDLESGSRGSRMDGVKARLIRLCGVQDALCVNNNAAAVLLALSALCDAGEVVVSRGEMVEIGGSFRVPDVISQGGARLVEVGTTNKTRLADYEAAISHDTAAILKVHTSNYRIVGFTETVSIEDLATLAAKHGKPLIYDLGGGCLTKLSRHEPTVQEVVSQGADVLCFSGDKLLGGPQCGIIAGKKAYIDKIAKHPLYRALRMDKLTLAALEATLAKYEEGRQEEIPVVAMLKKSVQRLEQDAEELISQILPRPDIFTASVIMTQGQAGGGSLPAEIFPSYAVAISPKSMPLQELERRLRGWTIPIVSRIYRNELLFDVRTVSHEELSIISDAINSIFGGNCHE
ncbi:MAG: L-seryl-tRNA(Sec) selenium transferase [Clostridiales bacterium]|jgi:L-seryl-tRNA(Ser) seleniumtransferase|nr:L-seryl-tRNA(Sec) selenium transferase [Clostridiales bacterium]